MMSVSVLVVVGSLCLVSAATAEPLLSEEIRFDSGFRYSNREEASFCRAVPTSGGAAFITQGLGGHESGLYLRNRGGGPAEPEARLSPDISPPETYLTAWDLVPTGSGPLLGIGAVVDADTNDHRRLVGRALSPDSLQALGPVIELLPLSYAPRNLIARWTGECVLIAWRDPQQWVHVLPARIDLTVAGPEVEIQEPAEAFDLAVGPTGGWLSIDALRSQVVLHEFTACGERGSRRSLDVDGPVYVGHHLIALEDRFLLFGTSRASRGQRWCRTLGRDGELVGSPIVWDGDSTSYRAWGALAASDSLVVDLEHAQDGNSLRVRRFSRTKGLLDISPISVAIPESLPRRQYGSWPPSATWTGEEFAIVWGNADEDSKCLLGSPDNTDLPTLHAAIGADGSVLPPGAEVLNLDSLPYAAGLHYTGGNLLSLSCDRLMRNFVHVRQLGLGLDGLPLSPGQRVRRYEWDDNWCGHAALVGVRVHPGYDGAYVSGAFAAKRSKQEFFDYSIDLDEFDALGEWKRRITLESSRSSRGLERVNQIDLDATSESLLVTFDETFHLDDNYHRVFLRVLGRTTGRELGWHATPRGVSSWHPTLTRMGGHTHLIWSEELDGHQELRISSFGRLPQGAPLSGGPLLEEPGDQTRPWIIQGDDQALCVWLHTSADSSETVTVHATRLSPSGAVLDPVPLRISERAGPNSSFVGVWTGLNYVLAWSEDGTTQSPVWLNRVTASGRVVDATGVELTPLGEAPGTPALLPDFVVAIPYGDRLRFLHDVATPTLPVQIGAEGSAGGISIRWQVDSEFADAESRLYRRDWNGVENPPEPPDAYQRIAAERVFLGEGSHEYLDTSAQADRWYAYAVALLGANGDWRWGPPATAALLANRPSLEIRIAPPNPFEGATEFRCALPGAEETATLELIAPSGRRIRTWDVVPDAFGDAAIRWDGHDASGNDAPAGVYFVALRWKSATRTARVIRLK